jgi:hypothetical protein
MHNGINGIPDLAANPRFARLELAALAAMPAPELLPLWPVGMLDVRLGVLKGSIPAECRMTP